MAMGSGLRTESLLGSSRRRCGSAFSVAGAFVLSRTDLQYISLIDQRFLERHYPKRPSPTYSSPTSAPRTWGGMHGHWRAATSSLPSSVDSSMIQWDTDGSSTSRLSSAPQLGYSCSYSWRRPTIVRQNISRIERRPVDCNYRSNGGINYFCSRNKFGDYVQRGTAA